MSRTSKIGAFLRYASEHIAHRTSQYGSRYVLCAPRTASNFRSSVRAQRGFLLIESVAAIFIIGVTIAIYAAALRSFAVSRGAGNEETALRIAERKIESLRVLGYAALPSSGSFTDAQLSTLSSSATGTITISDLNAKTKQVAVAVSWMGISATSTVSLTTLIVNAGGL